MEDDKKKLREKKSAGKCWWLLGSLHVKFLNKYALRVYTRRQTGASPRVLLKGSRQEDEDQEKTEEKGRGE